MFIGTTLELSDYREFSVQAAREGKSRSGLLKELALAKIKGTPKMGRRSIGDRLDPAKVAAAKSAIRAKKKGPQE